MLLYLISKRGLAFNLSQLGTFLIWSSYAWRGEPSFCSEMSCSIAFRLMSSTSFIPSLPFAVILHRPFHRFLFFLIVFSAFFAFFLPPTYVPIFSPNAPHFHKHHRPTHAYPYTFAPPPLSGPQRHRIVKEAQRRPVTRPAAGNDHRDLWDRRADAVRGAFLRAYNCYVTYAAPHDELRPLIKAPTNKCVLFFLNIAPHAPALFVVDFGPSRGAALMAGPSRI